MSMKLSHWLLCALAVLGLGVIASSATAAMPGTSTLEAEGLSITIDGAATTTRVWAVSNAQKTGSVVLFPAWPSETDPGEVRQVGTLTESEKRVAARVAAIVARFEQSPSPTLATAAQLSIWELVGSVVPESVVSSDDIAAEVAQFLSLAPDDDLAAKVIAFESTAVDGMRMLGVITAAGATEPSETVLGTSDDAVHPSTSAAIPSFEMGEVTDSATSPSPPSTNLDETAATTSPAPALENVATAPTTTLPSTTSVLSTAVTPTKSVTAPSPQALGQERNATAASEQIDLARTPIDRLPGIASQSGPQQLQNTPPRLRLSCPVRAPMNQPWQFRSKARDLEGDPLTFIWYRNGMRIPGASGPNLVSKVREYDRFDVVVSDGNKTAEVVRPLLCQGIVFGNSPEDADPPTTSKRTATTPKASPAAPETTSTAAVKPQAAGATTTTTPKPSGSSSSNSSDDPRAQVSANIARTEATNLRWQVSDALTLPWANTGGNVANGLWMGALFVALGACVVAISHAPRFARAVSPSA